MVKVYFSKSLQPLMSQNISHVTLGLLNREYDRASLGSALLNYASERENGLSIETFKTLASTEPIQARHPYGRPFTMKNYARMMFNSNSLPTSKENTKAYFRRYLIIPFNVTITEEDKDVELPQKIIASELSGVLNWMLEGLRRLLKEKKFTESESALEALREYRRKLTVLSFSLKPWVIQKVQRRMISYQLRILQTV